MPQVKDSRILSSKSIPLISGSSTSKKSKSGRTLAISFFPDTPLRAVPSK